MGFKKVQISSRAVGQIECGSLWIFANEFKTKMSELRPGEWVLFEDKKQSVGFGYVNPHSLITGRICSRDIPQSREELIFNLIKKSLARRVPRDSYRAVYSEGDHLPGLIIDVFGTVVVVQLTTAGMDQAKSDVISSIKKVLNPSSLIIRADSNIRNLEKIPSYVELVEGNEVELKSGVVKEDDLFVAADFIGGQKTGFFLDQRENRKAMRPRAQGKKILDLFCYSGGWGLSALKAGAQHVTFVDQSQEALNLVKKGLELNKFNMNQAELIREDVFDYLMKHKMSFDIVICDPPAFVKSKKDLPKGIKAYEKLNFLSLGSVNKNGFLFSSSCSYHLSEPDFEGLLMRAVGRKSREATVSYRGTQSQDHPWILNRPETRYLKCYGLQML